MKPVEVLADVYPAIEELIVRLPEVGMAKLAATLQHRMHEVWWNSRFELNTELVEVLLQTMDTDENLPSQIRLQLESVVNVIKSSGVINV